MSTVDNWINLETRHIQAANSLTRKKLGELADLDIRHQWLADSLKQDDWVVVPQPDEAYKLPWDASKFVNAALITELTDILSVVREVNNQVAGLRLLQADVNLAGDDRITETIARLRAWATQYVDWRLERTRCRDRDPVRQFQRIYIELLPRLEQIAFRVSSAHRCLMSDFTDFLPYILFERTCRPLLEQKTDMTDLSNSFRINSADPNIRSYLQPIVQLYQWAHNDDLAIILDRVGTIPAQSNYTYGREEILTQLQLLVSDIQEMRPFLLHNFKPENVLIEVADGLIVSWFWDTGRGLGMVPVAPSAAVMRAQCRNRTSPLTLSLSYDGLLACYAMPWIDSLSLLELRKNALHATLKIVEAIHTTLLSFYSKIDMEAILARCKNHSPGFSVIEPTDEEVAASCRLIADPIEDVKSSMTASFPHLRAIRMQRLLSVLSDRLSCEVRGGKGSEIVVFRSGGHHFRLGHHKRNTHVPAMLIKSLLQRVGIGFDEWLKAVT